MTDTSAGRRHAFSANCFTLGKKKKKLVSYLVAPFQHIFLTLLDFVVNVEELNDAVLSHMVGILLGFFPFQWRPL